METEKRQPIRIPGSANFGTCSCSHFQGEKSRKDQASSGKLVSQSVLNFKFSRKHLAKIIFEFCVVYGQYIIDIHVPVSEIEPTC